MTFQVITPSVGRGNFATVELKDPSIRGGTLNVKGDGPGPYYRAPTGPSKMPGLIGALAVRNSTPVGANEYAVHMGVKALQPYFGTPADGILGPNSDKSIRAYQTRKNLVVDGLVGPATCRSLFEPLVLTTVAKQMWDAQHTAKVVLMTLGTISVESAFDPGAVGQSTPDDVGIGQINAIHTDIGIDGRLTPAVAIPWMVKFIDANLRAMDYDLDAGIAAYNLGTGGASSWTKAGRPRLFHGTDVWAYIDRIKSASA